MPSRREFIQSSIGLGTCAVIACSNVSGGAVTMTDGQSVDEATETANGLIDAHSHIWTPRTDEYPLVDSGRKAKMKPQSFTPKELLKVARPHGIRRVVLIQHLFFHGFDNRYLTDTIRKYPGVFSGVAGIDDTKKRPQDEMLRLKKLGIRGFRIRPADRNVDRWLDSKPMHAMWQCAADENLTICHLIEPNAFVAIDRMCGQYPKTPVVIDHFGRIGITGTIDDKELGALCRLAKHQHVYVKMSAFYALGKKQPPYKDLLPMIQRLLDAFGPQRLMWASDCPYQVEPPHTYGASVRLIQESLDGLTKGDRDWILRRTAEKVFFN